ncbi:MAG: universal stress protein [Cyanobacteria bacterium SZAS TMP-1]|nr:universal stress protein [Cyanobacteria bacterium SZAS TMP-1]
MRIVVGVDGSAHSKAAIQAVLNHPWPDGSEIRLISVIRTLDTVIPAAELFFDTRGGAALGDIYQEAKRQLEIMAADLGHIVKNCHWSADVRLGDIAEGLMVVAEEFLADLIVVGSHGRSGIARIFLGSVSEALVTHAPCPVMVIKHRENEDPAKAKADFKRILVALDDSYFSGVAMHWIAARQWAEGAQFCLLHVANHDLVETPEQTKARHGEHETPAQHKAAIHAAGMFALKARAKYLAERMGHERFTCKVVEGKPSAAIIDMSEKWDADLIVMGSHGHESKALLILGSTTREVTAQAQCSVEVVRVPHSLVHSGHHHDHHKEEEHEREREEHTQIIDPAPRPDSRPHVPPGGLF